MPCPQVERNSIPCNQDNAVHIRVEQRFTQRGSFILALRLAQFDGQSCPELEQPVGGLRSADKYLEKN